MSVTRADIETLLRRCIADAEVVERGKPSATAGARAGAPARWAQADRDVGSMDVDDWSDEVGLPRRMGER